MEVELAPLNRIAAFSTGLGRRPARQPPFPPSPVIVRSNLVKGVVLYANYWRVKEPKIYHSFFPDSEWTISDLWDNAHIHIDSPGFLVEVLGFICRDNAFRAKAFVPEWSQAHPEKLDMIGGDMSQLYDVNNPTAIVDKIFTDGETEMYPHIFLWHVFRNMRICMADTMKKQQAAIPTAANQEVVKTNGEATGLAFQPATLSATSKPANPPQKAPTPYMSSAKAAPPTYAQFGPSGPQPRGPSYTSSQPERGYSTQMTGHPLGQHAAQMPPPYANGQLRNTKNRATRLTSNACGISPQARGWGDNIPHPLEHQLRQPSGHMTPGQSPHLNPPMPLGPGMMAANHMMQYPPPMSFDSPQMRPAQARYPSASQHAIMPPHATPYMGHPMEPNFPQFGPGGFEHQGIPPFGNMTNNLQYPPRGTDPRGPMARRTSSANKSSRLYNPYGNERPDKAGFTQVFSKSKEGKSRQVSDSRGHGRPRKASASFADSQSFEPGGSMRLHGYYGDPTQMRVPYDHTKHDVIAESDTGCDRFYIGPYNTTVDHLYVSNVPTDVTEEELVNFFQQHCGVMSTKVTLKSIQSGESVTYAFVTFASINDSRRALGAHNQPLRGKSLQVSVPKHLYEQSDVQTTSFQGYSNNAYGQANNRMPSHSSRSPTDDIAVPKHDVQHSPEDAVAVPKTAMKYSPQNDSAVPNTAMQYSPQDARSDLCRIGQQQQDSAMARGSPEAKKQKVQMAQSESELPAKVEQPAEEVKPVADPVDIASGQSVPAEQISAPQPIRNELSSTDAPKDSQVNSVESESTQPLEGDVALDPAITPSHSAVDKSEADKGAPVLETGPPDDAQPKDASNLAPLDPPSSPKNPVAKVVSPPAIDSPSKPGKVLPPSQETATVAESLVESLPHDVPAAVRPQDDTASDDDQKNDLSFHSAQESQSDQGNNERKGEAVETPKAHHSRSTSVVGDATSTLHQHADSKSAGEKLDSNETKAVTADKQEPDSTETEFTAAQPHETGRSVTAVDKPSSEAAKKPGAKQTQSLFPFAKPSKSQAKKERDAKKKEKKKDKGKGKTDKVAPVLTKAEATSPSASALDTTDHASESKSRPARTNATEAGPKPVALLGDVVHNALETDSVVRDTTTGANRNGRAEGKQATQELVVEPSTTSQTVTQTQPGVSPLEVSVSSHKEPESAVTSPLSVPGADEQEKPKDKDQTTKKTKHTPPMIAVPKLGDLLKARPSPASRTSAPESTSPRSQTSKDAVMIKDIGGEFEPHSLRRSQLTLVDPSKPRQAVADTVSGGSSPTLRAESPPPGSPSPKPSTFFTPAQTPSDFNARPGVIGLPDSVAGPAANATPKKKKNKSKKKKAGSSVVDTAKDASSTKDEGKNIPSTQDAFADQLSEIEGIKTANTTGSYYLRSGKEPSGDKGRSDDKVRSALVSPATCI
jgi:hypothetical protein